MLGIIRAKGSCMKKLLCLILVLCTAFTLLVSCGGGGEDEVSVFYYTYSDTYISSVRGEMEKMLKSAGLKFHNYDANGNQTTQTEQVDTAITKGTSMLIVNVVDTGSDDAAKAIVEKARAAEIPLIFFNRSVSESVLKSYEKCVYVGTDYEMAGKLQGEMIGNYLVENYSKYDLNGDGKISYVMFKGQQGNAEAEARTRLSVEECDKILKANGKPELMFYDKANANKYLVDQDGTWSSGASNNYMKTILSGYSEAGKNMIELVIANNDEMALGAISALNEAGYNSSGKKIIPVFGVDATEAAKSQIAGGAMAGTVKQDASGMAEAITAIAGNFKLGHAATTGLDAELVASEVRVNIPYSVYTGE